MEMFNELVKEIQRCHSFYPSFKDLIGESLTTEIGLDLLILIHYLFLIIPIFGKRTVSRYVEIFAIYTFASIHFMSAFCYKELLLLIIGCSVAGVITCGSIYKPAYKYIIIVGNFYVIFLGLIFMLSKITFYGMYWVYFAVAIICSIIINFLEKHNKKLVTRSLVCTLLAGVLFNFGIHKIFEVKTFAGTDRTQNLCQEIASWIGFFVLVIFHCWFLRYKGNFFKKEKKVSLLPLHSK